MDVRVRCCGVGPNHFASDGSHISESVVREYLDSRDYKLSIEGKLTLGYLTHRGRSIEYLPDSIGSSGLKKVIGRDDAGLCVGENLPTFTHYVKEFYIEDVPGEGPYLMALVHIFDENGFDHAAAENIRRLKMLIRNQVRLTCSLVVLAYWSNEAGNGIDECKKIKSIKSLDWTINPSFGPMARITEVIDDASEDQKELAKTFSEIENDKDFIKSQPKDGEIKVKAFSDLNSLGCANVGKSSKIDGKFCVFKAKEYSSVCSIVSSTDDEGILTEKLASETAEQPITTQEETQKEFSAATLRERIRYGNPEKFSPRVRLRRLYIDYKQVVKQMGGPEKIDPATMKTMKSLFAADLNMLMAQITPDIVKSGKQINTVLGCSALGVVPRKAAQALQMPYRMAFMEMEKTGKISPARFTKIKEAYTEFIKAMTNEVFGSSPMPEGLENAAEEEEKEVK